MAADLSDLPSLFTKLELLNGRELRALEELQDIEEERRTLEAECVALRQLLDAPEVNAPGSPSGSSSQLTHACGTESEHARTTIHSLPIELLIYIFTCTLASEWTQFDTLNLAHVCHQWRLIIFNTSFFWTSLLLEGELRGTKVCYNLSKRRPIQIIRSPSSSATLSIHKPFLFQLLSHTAPKWKALKWTSNEALLADILKHLNSRRCFSHLMSLDLTRNDTTYSFPATIPSTASSPQSSALPSRFPVLRSLKLSYVAPWELPPSEYPNLHTVELHYPGDKILNLRMSGLCALLFRSLSLRELKLDNSTPLMDIEFEADPTKRQERPVDIDSRVTHLRVPPIKLTNLTYLSWSCPPPKDLWRLFFFVEMPKLERFDVVLNVVNTRWRQVYGGIFSDMDSAQLISPLITFPVVRFKNLVELRVECLDSDGVQQAFKKMLFPALKNLSLSFIATNLRKLPELPRPESIFREPVLPNLQFLSIAYFELDIDHFRSFIQGLPILEELSFESCLKLDQAILMLAGVPSATISGTNPAPAITLPSPRLQKLSFIDCSDLKFSSLEKLVKERRRRVNSSGQFDVGTPSTPRRVFKPLRRKALGALSQDADSAKLIPFERPKVHSIRSLSVAGCSRVSEVELLSLQGDEYDVADVFWSDA